MVISICNDAGVWVGVFFKVSILKAGRVSPTLPFGRQGFISSQLLVAANEKPVCFRPLTMKEVQSKPGAIQPFPLLYNFHFISLPPPHPL